MGLFLVQLLVDGIPSFRCVSCTTLLGLVDELAEGALSPAFCVTDEGAEEHQSQDRALRDITCHQPPPGYRTIDHNFLAVSIQTVVIFLTVHS